MGERTFRVLLVSLVLSAVILSIVPFFLTVAHTLDPGWFPLAARRGAELVAPKPNPFFKKEKKSAILISLHKFDPYVWIRLEKLARDVSPDAYDVFVFCDGSVDPLPDDAAASRVRALGFKYLLHKRQEIKRVYSEKTYRVFTAPYSSPDNIGSVMWASRHLDEYVSFWFLEPDVGFSGNWSVLLSAHDDKRTSQPDLLVPRLNDVFLKSWTWFKSCRAPECAVKTRMQIFWPIARCTPLFIRILHDRLRVGTVAMHEAFVGSVCAAHPKCSVGKFSREWVDGRQTYEGAHFACGMIVMWKAFNQATCGKICSFTPANREERRIVCLPL